MMPKWATAVKWRQERASLVRFRNKPLATSFSQVHICQQRRRPASDRRPRPRRVDRLRTVNAPSCLTCRPDMFTASAPSTFGSSTSQLGRDASTRLVSSRLLQRCPRRSSGSNTSTQCGRQSCARPETTRPCNSRPPRIALATHRITHRVQAMCIATRHPSVSHQTIFPTCSTTTLR